MPTGAWHVLLNIALRTTVIYAVVLVGVRLSGKREVGQMTPFDLTVPQMWHFMPQRFPNSGWKRLACWVALNRPNCQSLAVKPNKSWVILS
jgi:hypothetical protein